MGVLRNSAFEIESFGVGSNTDIQRKCISTTSSRLVKKPRSFLNLSKWPFLHLTKILCVSSKVLLFFDYFLCSDQCCWFWCWHYFTACEFSPPALIGGFSLKLKWPLVSSDLQYSSWFWWYCCLHSYNSSDLDIFPSLL